jgi:PAS domain-containing protein
LVDDAEADGGKAAVNGDARAIARAVCQPLLVLADDLTVEVANAAFCATFASKPEQDEGRKLFEIANGRWAIRPLLEMLEDVLAARSEGGELRIDHTFEDIGHRVLLASACPAHLEDGRRHLLLSLEDATEAERLRFDLEGQKELSEKIFDASRDALLVLGWDLRVKSANQTFYTKFAVNPDETRGRLVYELGDGQWNIPRLRELLETVLPDNDSFDGFVVEHRFQQIGHRVMLLNARRIYQLQLILLAIEDVTERARVEEARRAGEDRLRRVLETDAVGVLFFDGTGTVVDANDVFLRMTGYSRDEVNARELTWRRMTPPEWVALSEEEMGKLGRTGRIGPYEK